MAADKNQFSKGMANYSGKRYLSVGDTYISDTAVRLGNTLTTILGDAKMKYVIGQIDRPGFDAEVARWRAAGGDQVKADYTAAYRASPR
jgi:hypothetical protein